MHDSRLSCYKPRKRAYNTLFRIQDAAGTGFGFTVGVIATHIHPMPKSSLTLPFLCGVAAVLFIVSMVAFARWLDDVDYS